MTAIQPRVILLSILSIAIFLSGYNGFRVSNYGSWADIFFLCLALSWSIFFFRLPHKRPPLYVVISFILLLAAFLLAPYNNSEIRLDRHALEFIKFTIALFIITYLIFDIINNGSELNIIITAYIISAVFNSFVGLIDLSVPFPIAQYLGVETSRSADYAAHNGRAYGLTAHPNHLGYHCVIGLTLLFGSKDIKIFKNRYAAWTAALILFIGIVASGSRASLIAILIVSIWYVYSHQLWPRKAKVIVVITVSLTCLFIYAYLNKPKFLGAITRLVSPTYSEEFSNTERLNFFSEAWSVFLLHPFSGAGFEYINTAHNIYLQVLQSGGLIALIAFFIYLLFPLTRALIISYKKSNDVITICLSSAFISLLLMGLFQNVLYARFAVIPIALVWVITNSEVNSNRSSINAY